MKTILLFYIYAVQKTIFRLFILESQIYRMLLVCCDETSDERSKLVDSKLAFMSQGFSANSYLEDSAQFVLQCISLKENAERITPNEHFDFGQICMSYSGGFLQIDETEGMLQNFQHNLLWFFFYWENIINDFQILPSHKCYIL